MATKQPFIFNFKNTMTFYVITICFLFLGWIVILSQHGKLSSETNQVMIGIMGILNLLVGYLWGSSSANKEKDKTIDRLIASQPPTYTGTPFEILVAKIKAGERPATTGMSFTKAEADIIRTLMASSPEDTQYFATNIETRTA